MPQFMVEYFTEDGRNPDCHPEFFDTKASAETQGRAFMGELDWAVRMEIREVAEIEI